LEKCSIIHVAIKLISISNNKLQKYLTIFGALKQCKLTNFISQIRHRAVIRKLRKQQIQNVADCVKLGTHNTNGIQDKLIEHVKYFTFNAPMERVWDSYKRIGPIKAWSSKLMEFSFMYNKSLNDVSLHNCVGFPELNKSQLHILVLKVLYGSVQICVGYEVTEVNDKDKYFTTEYLSISKSMGYQTIQLESVSDEVTRITHYTKYFSGNWLRDRIMYPLFHSMTVKILHRNVKAFLNENP